MSKEKEIVDLIPSEGGVYSIESRHHPVLKKRDSKFPKPKYVKHAPVSRENIDEFFDGMDVGLDFLEGMQKRIGRMLKLRD